jgi:hypothetical protein
VGRVRGRVGTHHRGRRVGDGRVARGGADANKNPRAEARVVI